MESMLIHEREEFEKSNRIKKLVTDKTVQWCNQIPFVSRDGKVFTIADCPPEMKDIFQRYLSNGIEQACSYYDKLAKEITDTEKRLTKSDCKKITRAQKNPNKFNPFEGLSDRAIAWINKVNFFDTYFPRFEIYELVAPHTFCFSPVPQNLEKLLEPCFDIAKFNQINSNTLRCPPTEIFWDEQQNTTVMFYLNTLTPEIKIKLYSTHKTEQDKDILDIETRVVPHTTKAEIAHYHVEKTATQSSIRNAYPNTPSRYSKIEFTKSASGNIRVAYYDHEGEHRALTDVNSKDSQDWTAILKWCESPLLAGGHLYDAIVKHVQKSPRAEALAHAATRYTSPISQPAQI